MLREQLVRPIVYELWLWGLRLESLPFNLIWLFFLVLASLSVYVAVIDLALKGRRRSTSFETELREGPLRVLAHKIELACHGELARWNVHRALGDVAINWVALHHGINEGEARQRFKNKEVLSELHRALTLEFPSSPTRRGWLWVSGRLLALSPAQKRHRLQELAHLIHILEDFAGEAYAPRPGKHR
jgi:hypothetical protein